MGLVVQSLTVVWCVAKNRNIHPNSHPSIAHTTTGPAWVHGAGRPAGRTASAAENHLGTFVLSHGGRGPDSECLDSFLV